MVGADPVLHYDSAKEFVEFPTKRPEAGASVESVMMPHAHPYDVDQSVASRRPTHPAVSQVGHLLARFYASRPLARSAD